MNIQTWLFRTWPRRPVLAAFVLTVVLMAVFAGPRPPMYFSMGVRAFVV